MDPSLIYAEPCVHGGKKKEVPWEVSSDLP